MRLITIALLSLLFIPIRAQLVINELLPDPSPQVSLPNAEFIELYNAGITTVDLTGYTISDPTRTGTLPAFQLAAGSYVILCDDDDIALFTPFGDVLSLSNFPTLNNSGDEIELHDNNNMLLDAVRYTTAWYNDALKDNGGWTLERINPLNDCDEKSNWTASSNSTGGSPGAENSVFDNTFFDNSAFSISYVEAVQPNLITIGFTKKPDVSQVGSGTFQVDGGIGGLVNCTPNSDGKTLFCEITSVWQGNQLYSLTISGLDDCNGNTLDNSPFSFGIPVKPSAKDLVINEILFNPVSGGSDFVELFNRSENIISIDGLTILELDPLTDAVEDFVRIEQTNKLILPGEYWVFTEDPAHIESTYQTTDIDKVVDVSLPNYPDDEGVVAVLNSSLDTLDKVSYSSNWHFDLISDENGVSLERLDPSGESNLANNWHSASFTVGNASPTLKNSQFFVQAPNADQFEISPAAFTPDGDGMDDFLSINFNSSLIGQVATIEVFNIRGNPVRKLVNNQLLGNNNFIRWDGLNDNGEQLPIGHYIVVISLFDSSGNTTSYKEKVTLSRRQF